MLRDLRLALLGFGNVGRRFAELLSGPYDRILREQGVQARVTGIFTLRHGVAIDARGVDLGKSLALVRAGQSLKSLRGAVVASSLEFVRRAPADVLIEASPLDPQRGQPAVDHVRAALRRGLHVVTVNKGPVAFAHASLRGLAHRRGLLFLHEGAVMDGTPVFNLVDRCLKGARVLGFRGTLNTTTNHLFSRWEEGVTTRTALREARELGITEADPRADLDGWDASVKGCALANALMGGSVSPSRVSRRGVLGLRAADARRALRQGRRLRLVVRGAREGRRVRVWVAPERIPLGDPLSLSGPDAALVLTTDLMGEVGVIERGASVDQTAYALLSDLMAVAAFAAARPGGDEARLPRRSRLVRC